MLTIKVKDFKLRQTNRQTGITIFLNSKPIARLLVFAMAFLCAITLDVNAETYEYNVCQSGCEYSNLADVFILLKEKGISFNGDKIIINLKDNSNYNLEGNSYYINSVREEDNYDNLVSFSINGNNNEIKDVKLYVCAKEININNIIFKNYHEDINNYINQSSTIQNNSNLSFASDIVNIDNVKAYGIENKTGIINVGNSFINGVAGKGDINISNSSIFSLNTYSNDSRNINIDNSTIDYIPVISNSNIYFTNSSFGTEGLMSQIVILNSKLVFDKSVLSSSYLMLSNSSAKFSNSVIGKLFNYSYENDSSTINIYNSNITGSIYLKHNQDEINDLFSNAEITEDPSTWPFDIIDLYSKEDGTDLNTYIHYEEIKTVRPNEFVSMLDLFKYLTNDKEIKYSIDNESIVKIDNNSVIGINEGKTKIIATTDNGHFIFTLDLIVEKESIPEKIDKMTIKVPITGNKVKLWIIVVSIVLLSIIGICLYILIKRKK